jgi:hypothetical protein
MNDQAIESEIQTKGLTAPRVTLQDIEDNIVSEVFFTAEHGVVGAISAGELHARYKDVHQGNGPLGLLTFCVLVLKNGFTITGESACASPENFDSELGRKIARQNAVNKIWPLLGFSLKERLHEATSKQ